MHASTGLIRRRLLVTPALWLQRTRTPRCVVCNSICANIRFRYLIVCVWGKFVFKITWWNCFLSAEEKRHKIWSYYLKILYNFISVKTRAMLIYLLEDILVLISWNYLFWSNRFILESIFAILMVACGYQDKRRNLTENYYKILVLMFRKCVVFIVKKLHSNIIIFHTVINIFILVPWKW